MRKTKLFAVVGSICMILALVLTYSGGPALVGADRPAPEDIPGLAKKAPSEVLLPPDVMRVVYMAGTNYEMGYQYGQQAGDYIKLAKDYFWSQALQTYSYDDVIYMLKGFQYYIAEYAPEEIEQMKGMAAGATDAGYDVSYTDIMLINTFMELMWAPPTTPTVTYPSPVSDLPPGCSGWAAWGSTTVNGHLIGGIMRDLGPYPWLYQVTLVAFPDEGNAYVGTVMAGHLAENFFMNDKGLFIAANKGPNQRDVDIDYGIPHSCVNSHIAQFADTAAEARDMLLDWQLTQGMLFQYTDTSGDSFVLETTAAHKGVRTSGDFGETDFIVETNHFDIPEMQVSGMPGAGSVARYDQLFDSLAANQGDVDLALAKEFMRTPPVCHWRNVAANLALVNEQLAYICTGSPGTETFPVNNTGSFYEIALKSDPAAVTQAAGLAAWLGIGKAGAELTNLDFGDVEYAPLKAIFAQAKAEYFEGSQVEAQAGLGTGDEALILYGQATTAYASAQAHALQVYNALVLP